MSKHPKRRFIASGNLHVPDSLRIVETSAAGTIGRYIKEVTDAVSDGVTSQVHPGRSPSAFLS